jgi:hypothetical protein
MCLPVSRLFWVSSLAYPNLLGTIVDLLPLHSFVSLQQDNYPTVMVDYVLHVHIHDQNTLMYHRQILISMVKIGNGELTRHSVFSHLVHSAIMMVCD